MSSLWGNTKSSRVGAYGIGTSCAVTRMIGPSSHSNARSLIRAAISPATPPVRVSSWTIRTFPVFLAVASMVYGLTHAVASTESQTVPMDLPASVAIAGLFGARWWGVRAMPGGPVFAFYGLAHGVVLLFLATWGLYFGGFPEPSQLLAGRG